jgi:hypothetical protein
MFPPSTKTAVLFKEQRSGAGRRILLPRAPFNHVDSASGDLLEHLDSTHSPFQCVFRCRDTSDYVLRCVGNHRANKGVT